MGRAGSRQTFQDVPRLWVLAGLTPGRRVVRNAIILAADEPQSCHARVNLSSSFLRAESSHGAVLREFLRSEIPAARKLKLKWAASQEAVTFPWLSAHSIRKGIGGDTYIVNPGERLSRTSSGNLAPSEVLRGEFARIDTVLARVLVLLVLQAAILRAESAAFISRASIKGIWSIPSDN